MGLLRFFNGLGLDMSRRGCYLPKVIHSTYLLTMWIERREYISKVGTYLGTHLSNVHHQAIESTLTYTLRRDG